MSTLSFHLTGLKHTRIALKDEKGNDVMGTFIPDARNDLKPTEKGAVYINCWVNDINAKFLEALKKNGQEATHSLQLRLSEEMSKKLKAWNESHPEDKKFAPNLGVLDMGKPAGVDPISNAVPMSAPANGAAIQAAPGDDDCPF